MRMVTDSCAFVNRTRRDALYHKEWPLLREEQPMRYSTTLMLVMAQSALAGEPVDKQWSKIAPVGAGFQVMFPGTPKESSKPPNVKDPSYATQLLTWEASKTNLYIVSYVDLPTPVPKDRESKVLESIRDGREKHLKGDVVKDGIVIRGKLTGRQFTIKIAAGMYYRSVIFLKNSRAYQVYVLGSEKEVTGKDAERFLNSFEVLTDDGNKK
jgi:hypothetical protein